MPVGEPGEPSPSISVIWPALPPQSMQVLPWFELNPRTTWLKTLYASKRNCALMRSVTVKLLESDMSEKNARGPRKESNPALPTFPQAGSANGPDVGRAKLQESTPASAGPAA